MSMKRLVTYKRLNNMVKHYYNTMPHTLSAWDMMVKRMGDKATPEALDLLGKVLADRRREYYK